MRGFGDHPIRLKRCAALCLVAASAMVVTGTVAHAQLGGLFSGKNLEDLIVSQFAKSGAAPDGDRRKRLDDGSLSLTPAEEARANQAASLFSQVPAAGQTQAASMEYQAGTPAGRAQLTQLRNLLKQYQSKATLTPDQRAALRDATMPFYLAYLRQSSAEAGDPVEIIPPKTTQSFEFAAYCMDRNYAAPGANEQFQLVPTSSLVPPEMLPAYKGALRHAAQTTRAHDSSVQGLMWQMRDTASGRALTQPQLSLSPQQQSILNSSDPNAVSLLQNYYQRNDEARKKVETTRKAVRIAAKLLGMDLSAINPSRIISPITNNEAIRSIQATTRSLEAMKPGGRVLGQNSGYTMIGEGVAAHAFSPNGGLRSINVRIANTTSKPVAFSPKSCAAQSTRKVQRLAIQPNYAAKTTRPRADIFAPQYGRFDRASYTTFADPQARMTRLVWDGQRPQATKVDAASDAIAIGAFVAWLGILVISEVNRRYQASDLPAKLTALLSQGAEDCAETLGTAVCANEGVLTPELEIQKDREYKNYVRVCKQSPPPELKNNPCEKAKFELNRQRQCLQLRQEWDRKWSPGEHAGQIAEVERSVKNAEDRVRRLCKNQN